MARKPSFNQFVTQLAREQSRQQRQAQARQREFERHQRDAIRQQALNDKAAKERYLRARAEEIDEKNRELKETVQEIKGVLERTLLIDDTIVFDSLRIKDSFPPPPQPSEYPVAVKKPGRLESLIPGVKERYLKACQLAENNYSEAIRGYDERKKAFVQQVLERNQEVDEVQNSYFSGDPDAITSYLTMVLERSIYPLDFPHEFHLAYVPEPKEVVVEYELPGIEIIPPVNEFRFVKSADRVDEKPRKANEIKELYQDLIASICLRTIHELTESDQGDHIAVVTFNGFVQTVDPATGHEIRPCLISVRTTKEKFCQIALGRVDKGACLRNLGAQVSPRPYEMQPVKPIIEFNMVDKRFVEQSDVLADLESRPNLMELNPFEFENLVSNLFERIGFQAKLTRSSKDGGVDAIAYDPRPLLGGKVVVQAKRYKHVVGVSAVRDLYGTMINEGANKGILVTTSHYGPDAYEFSKDKPIELIDGGGLLYLLEQQGVSARIIFPND